MPLEKPVFPLARPRQILADLGGAYAANALVAFLFAASGPVAEGNVGGGTGMITCDLKGGIGTSSRRLPAREGGYTLGVLVMSNFGKLSDLRIAGAPVGERLSRRMKPVPKRRISYGSIIAVLATDAPLSDRNLTRLARRALAGLARTGAAMSDGSGDYAIAFSTAEDVRRTPARRAAVTMIADLPNAALSPLFLAAIEATEEAIYNALCMATTTTGFQGRTVEALPLDRLVALWEGRR